MRVGSQVCHDLLKILQLFIRLFYVIVVQFVFFNGKTLISKKQISFWFKFVWNNSLTIKQTSKLARESWPESTGLF